MTEIDITRLTELALLELSPAEHLAVKGDLSRIIAMVDQMQNVATEGVAPLSNPLDATARLRPDEVTEVVDRELLQAGAPATADGFYLVPRVVE